MRQHTPEDACVEHQQDSLQDRVGQNRFATTSVVRQMLRGNVLANPGPLRVGQTEHRLSYLYMNLRCQKF